MRARALTGLRSGVELDRARNEAVRGEGSLHTAGSRVGLHVLRTDEEWIVARQTFELLSG